MPHEAGRVVAMSSSPLVPVGIGWRQPHYAELLERRPALGFIEVHSENFFGDGGAALAVLAEGRAQYPVSLHGVGLSLGSAAGIDPWHLERLARLCERIEPVRVSDHASFARAPGQPGTQRAGMVHANDLLPLAFTRAALDILVDNVEQVQQRLKRPLLVENLSAYVAWADDTLDEAEFFNALCKRSGCGLLLDVNNLVVNALNAARGEAQGGAKGATHEAMHRGALKAALKAAHEAERTEGLRAVRTACSFIDRIDPANVGEIHLAGYADLGDIVIDDHGSQVHAPVWAVYRHALARLGARPTLIEWDANLPALHVLLGQAALAAGAVAGAAREPLLEPAT